MTNKSRKNSCFEVLDGLFCELEASAVTWTYFKKKFNFFFSCFFFLQFLVIKALDPDWIRIRIRIGLHPDPLDPDPDP